MKITLADKIIAWLALLSGLTISAVAIWYSVAGLVSIFAAAVIPIIVMGVVLEISKLIATVWLKLNWHRAPAFIRTYLLVSIGILMVITSMGIFGFLSKAHSDQSLVSGDVQAKIAVYDEKIKVAKDNINANRTALKQLDEAVDQTMVRSTTETGADRAVNIRRSQQPERKRLLSEIQAEQKTIASLNEESAPIRAEVRKVEAEVGPIKYIANFIYGDNPEANVLEKAVTWVIIIIVAVFDPLAVILLLASQYSFQWFRQAKEEEEDELVHDAVPLYVADVGEKPTEEEKAAYETDLAAEANALIAEIEPVVPEVILPNKPMKFTDPGEHPSDKFERDLEESEPVVEKPLAEQHPYLNQPFSHFKDLTPMVYKPEPAVEEKIDPLDQWNKMIEAAEQEVAKEKTAEEILDEGLAEPVFQIIPELQSELKKSDWPENPFRGMQAEVDGRHYIFNGSDWINYEQSNKDAIRDLENAAEAELKKKSSYMIKDQDQQIKKLKE